MKTLPLILTCLASGAVGAGATHFLAQPAPTQASGDFESIEARLSSLSQALNTRDGAIEELKRELRRVQDESELVGYMPERTSVPQDLPVTAVQGDAIVERSGMVEIAGQSISVADFDKMIRNSQARIREQERIEREQERAVAEGERIETRVAALATELGLDSHQQSEFRRFLSEQNDKRREVMDSMRDAGGDRTQMRDTFQKMRDDATRDLQSFLTMDQYERYQESDNNDMRMFRGPGGGGRGGFGGRGGNGGGDGGNQGGNGGGGRNQ